MGHRHPQITNVERNGRTDYDGRWGSIEEFAETAKWSTLNRDGRASDSSTDTVRGEHSKHSWSLGDDFDGVFNKVMNGWPEMAKRIKDVAMPVVSKVFAHVEMDHFDHVEDGSLASGFDVAAVAQGEPYYWLQHKTDIVEGKGTKVVRICSNVSASYGTDGEKLVKRGVVATALAYCLEAAGFMVEVIASDISLPYGNRQTFWIGIKQPGQTMDLNRIATALCHPGTLRRLRFAVSEGDERLAGEFGSGGYGSVGSPTPEDIEREKIDIVIGNDVFYLSEEGLVQHVLDLLEKQGVGIRK
jgi:hypothetical protein